MAAPVNEYAFDYEVMRQAASHWQQHKESREQKTASLKENHYVLAESRQRLAKRANRLIAQVKETLSHNAEPDTAETISEGLKELVERGPIREDEISNDLMERVIGETRDFLSIEFLEKAMKASRCVGRIVTELGRGRKSFGTGFLVSPRLLLTNNHVLPSAELAAISLVEFDFQPDILGNALTVQRFTLLPDAFFLTDKGLDFSLVAVAETSKLNKPLSAYGFLPLMREEGKIILKDCVNIIQHPRGEMKQVVIRENELVDLLDSGFAHYKGDTEPGSSGSPAFNDQWEVVALHHSGVPKMDGEGNFIDINGNIWRPGDDPSRLVWVANEGIRVSRLVDFISKASINGQQKTLQDQLLTLGMQATPTPNTDPIITPGNETESPAPQPPTVKHTEGSATLNIPISINNGSITLTIPLTITISLGTPIVAGQPASDELGLEAIRPDPDYSNRPGYDPDFLGFNVPLPKLTNSIRSQALEVPGGNGANKFELKYYHYSVIMNRRRRIAFVSAVNSWADAPFKQGRTDKDKWFTDPRIGSAAQTDEDLYRANPLDRGHLTRRDDAAWGNTAIEAKQANDDTFHFTNCSPQHEIFNQSQKASQKGLSLWGNIENHITRQALRNQKKLTVFNGPIFRNDDRLYRGVQLPREFWKLVVMEKDNGKPAALAFILSQESFIKDLPQEEFVVGEYKPFQVKIRELESRTKLDFGLLRTFDPLNNELTERFFESGTEAIPLESLDDMILED
ncbi:DNA/RNA non-specific endonuclease [Nibrella saemangeumensis]|uniref:DNA/RNA non-specific endonuclease n=1 Tax=Nibrella saemangeumensis TaxID=1084526 RepID=A0ABP8MLE0_9BACT